MDLSKLSPEEQGQFRNLVEKANGNPGPGHPPDYDESQRGWGECPPANQPTVTRVISAEDWVSKQIGTLEAVGETNYRAGITRPKKDPIAAGIAAQGAYEAAMKNPAVLKRREAKLKQTNMGEWARMAEEVGAARLVSGVVARRYKVERAIGTLQAKLTEHLRKIDALPAVTDSDRERRMVENLRGLKAMKGLV